MQLASLPAMEMVSWLISCPRTYLVKLREQKLLRSSSPCIPLYLFPYTYSGRLCLISHCTIPYPIYLPYHAMPTHTIPRTMQQYSGKVKHCLCLARCLHRYTVILYASYRKVARRGLVAACVCVTDGISDRKIVF